MIRLKRVRFLPFPSNDITADSPWKARSVARCSPEHTEGRSSDTALLNAGSTSRICGRAIYCTSISAFREGIQPMQCRSRTWRISYLPAFCSLRYESCCFVWYFGKVSPLYW